MFLWYEHTALARAPLPPRSPSQNPRGERAGVFRLKAAWDRPRSLRNPRRVPLGKIFVDPGPLFSRQHVLSSEAMGNEGEKTTAALAEKADMPATQISNEPLTRCRRRESCT